jgi:hypothetical protein
VLGARLCCGDGEEETLRGARTLILENTTDSLDTLNVSNDIQRLL